MTKAQQEIATKQEVHLAKDITPPNVIKRDVDKIKDNEAKLRAAYERDSQMVRIVFRRLDGNTDPVTVPYLKHRWEKLKQYTMVHGQVHTIPLGLAEHLRDNCKTPIYGEKAGKIVLATVDAAGNMPDIVGYNHRFSVSSLDFALDNSSLTQVQKSNLQNSIV